MTFQIVLAAEPYYYNCQGCGCVLMVPGNVPQTEGGDAKRHVPPPHWQSVKKAW